MKYSGNITGGALLARESRIVARLLLESSDREAVRDRILSENLFQNNAPRTTKTYYRLILPRLDRLTPGMLRLVVHGSEEVARMTLLAAVLRTFDLVADFLEDVLCSKVRSFEPALQRTDWSRFLEERATVDSSIHDWSETTRTKTGQVVFRMLDQAGYLADTRSLRILFPTVPEELASELEADGDQRTLTLLRLGRS